VVRPERFELPAFWFVVGKAGNPKALQVSHFSDRIDRVVEGGL